MCECCLFFLLNSATYPPKNAAHAVLLPDTSVIVEASQVTSAVIVEGLHSSCQPGEVLETSLGCWKQKREVN